MVALIFFSILVVAVLFLLGWGLISYWQNCRKEKKKRQKLLEELSPWLKNLTQMDDKQFEEEFKRILGLWMKAKEAAATLQLQFDLVCQEDGRRRGLKHQKRHYRFSRRVDKWL